MKPKVRVGMIEGNWRNDGIELLPADPSGWWAMPRASMETKEWSWGETPQEALLAFLKANEWKN